MKNSTLLQVPKKLIKIKPGTTIKPCQNLQKLKPFADNSWTTSPLPSIKETRSPVISSILHTPKKRLRGDVLVNLKRHGKILIFQLQSGRLMIAQLGMTGHWRISTRPLQTKHVHLQLQGKDHTLSYIDPRRFGHIYIWQKSEWQRYQKKQGIDPSSTAFNPDNFCQAIQRFPQRMLKVTLLDQSLFSGVGNYMANEICALARIRPTRRCHRLSQKQLQKLFAATLDVTSAAVRSGGTTFQGGYQDAFGRTRRRRTKPSRILSKNLPAMPQN